MGMPALPGAGPIGGIMGNGGVPTAPAAAPAPGPEVPPDAGALSVLNDINSISRAGRSIRERYPATMPLIDELDSIVQQLQMKILQALPPTNVAAPPI